MSLLPTATTVQSHPVGLVAALIFTAVWVWGWICIFAKSGHSRWLGLLFAIPALNVFLFCWFAFSKDWPVHRRAIDAETRLRRAAAVAAAA
jgi:hypothetical protein